MKSKPYLRIERLTPEMLRGEQPIWVNPVGGLGDIIMLSTVLMHCYEQYGKKFHVARRTHYTDFFVGHPAVVEIGHPEPESLIICNDYWSRPDFNDVNKKAIDILYDIFCVDNHRQPLFVVSHAEPKTEVLLKNIPWAKKNIIICISSESPRKMMHPMKWHMIVDKLITQHFFVLQVGGPNDIPIKGAYSIIGTTSPNQIISILGKADVVVTVDNFVMHAAEAAHIPTVSLFGPTEESRYAYDDHISLQVDTQYCPHHSECLGPHVADNYATSCPLCEDHCMNHHNENQIVDAIMSIIKE